MLEPTEPVAPRMVTLRGPSRRGALARRGFGLWRVLALRVFADRDFARSVFATRDFALPAFTPRDTTPFGFALRFTVAFRSPHEQSVGRAIEATASEAHHDGREDRCQKPIQTIHQPAMAGNEMARILRAEMTLDR